MIDEIEAEATIVEEVKEVIVEIKEGAGLEVDLLEDIVVVNHA